MVREPSVLVTSYRHYTDAVSHLGRIEDGLDAVLAASARLRADGAVDPLAILLDAVAGELLHRMARFDECAAKAELVLAESITPVPRAVAHALTGVVHLERLELADAHEHLERARMEAVGLGGQPAHRRHRDGPRRTGGGRRPVRHRAGRADRGHRHGRALG